MHKLPDAWVSIPAERGSYSRGVIHTDPVSGLSIHGEDFNGVYYCGEVDGDLYVVCHEPEGGAGFELHVLRKNYPRDPEAVEKCETMAELHAWQGKESRRDDICLFTFRHQPPGDCP